MDLDIIKKERCYWAILELHERLEALEKREFAQLIDTEIIREMADEIGSLNAKIKELEENKANRRGPKKRVKDEPQTDSVAGQLS